MSGLIPEEFINDVRHRADIVDVIREYLPLKKQGQNYIGLCPFHAEKTPSFVVSPQKQIYHCFGCGKGGHVFSFIMEKNGVSYPEAIKLLAGRYGMTLPTAFQSQKSSEQEALRKRYYQINDSAAKYYQQVLHSPAGREALAYLAKRGMTKETKEMFQLGYATAAWDQLTRYLLDQGIQEEELLLMGLSVKSQKGNLVDRFFNRIIFPITDDAGRVIAFGGRVLDNSQPKYLNSPETPLFHKGKQLYGIHPAKGSIRKLDQAIIMEGYMDVITAHQYGITNTVGSLGTALTSEQARLLMRYTYNTIICFDADAAGQEAAARGLEILQQSGCQVSVMEIPEAKDPDEFLKNHGNQAFIDLIGHAHTLLEYKLLKLMKKYNTETIPGKIQVVQMILPDMQKVQSPVARQSFIQMIAEKLALPEQVIQAEIKKSYHKTSAFASSERTRIVFDTISDAPELAQRNLIRLILGKPEVLPEVEKWGGSELFSNSLLKEIYRSYYLLRQAGHNIKANDLIFLLESEETRQILSEILLKEEFPNHWERIFKDCLVHLKLETLKKKISDKTEIMSQYEKSGDVSNSLIIMAQIQQLVRDKQSLMMSLRKGGNDLEN
mgnify:CR=1 FL=1